MNKNLRIGVNFGLISGILTASGIVAGMVGVGAGKGVILSGILVIAFADAFSDALGIYHSYGKEAQAESFWQSIVLSFFAKLIVASTFLVPALLTSSSTALTISIAWAVLLLSVLGYYLNSRDTKKSVVFVLKNIAILGLIVILSYYIGGIFKEFRF